VGATFSRLKTWGVEILKHLDLNAEFDNIINNLTPAGIDDLSSNAAAMQGTADPYPGGVASAPTSLAGELQRLRYLLTQITGETYWYIDPDTSIAAINVILTRLQTLGQWQLQADVPTHVSGTSFTVPTDKTATYAPGRRTMCTVTAGTIYGTIVSSAFTTVTTVTVINDSGALDSGLSAVALGIATITNEALQRFPVLEKVNDYTVAITDFARTIKANKGTAIAFTLPAATAVPTGWYVNITNIGAGVLTLTGTVNGSANPVFGQYDGCVLFSDGVAWYMGPHARKHNMTSTLDHAAGANKLFYSNGSGQLVELALGAAGNVLKFNGTTSAPTAGQVGSADIATGAITGAKLALTTTAGTQIYLAYAPTTRSGTAGAIKQTVALTRGGVVTISFQFASSADGYIYTVYATLYKNGAPIGATQENATTTYATVSGTYSVAIGDVIQVVVASLSGGTTVFVRNLTVTAQDPYCAGETL
jgi:hypothetical protein